VADGALRLRRLQIVGDTTAPTPEDVPPPAQSGGANDEDQQEQIEATDNPSKTDEGRNAMKRWHLPTLGPSSDKRTPREPGHDAPRVPTAGPQKPRVLFSSPECRLIALDLDAGEELADHHVRERAVVQVISGRVSIAASGETVECDAGTLVKLEPGERHAVRGIEDARLLLVLAPWPAAGHNSTEEHLDPQHLPANAISEPIVGPPRDDETSTEG
jgi:quercetin dioxygenase-like cupin family protein